VGLFASLIVLAVATVAFGQTNGPILFSDDLEQGPDAWTIFPGNPICTAPRYVTTATDPNANHTLGGSAGFQLTAASDRVYHDIGLTGFPNDGVHLSLWFYDTLDRRAYSFEPFDIRSPNSSQVLGLGAYFDANNYEVRVLKSATGTSPNWLETDVPRTLGWHQFELFQYRQPGADTVDFYIDGKLAYHVIDAMDATLNRVVLGLGFANNIYQSGYVDDILVTTVPEPGVATLVVAGGLIAIGRRKSRARSV
jgi:hypothetical protein